MATFETEVLYRERMRELGLLYRRPPKPRCPQRKKSLPGQLVLFDKRLPKPQASQPATQPATQPACSTPI